MTEYKNLKIHSVLKKIKNRYNRQHWEEIDEALNEIAEIYTKFSTDDIIEDLEAEFETILDYIDIYSRNRENSFYYSNELLDANKDNLLKKFEVFRERLILIGCSVSKIEVNDKRIQMRISW